VAYYLQIDCGGSGSSPYISESGYVSGGGTFSDGTTNDLSGVTDPPPQSVTQSEHNGDQTWTLSGLTPSTTYKVRMFFLEIYFTESTRSFNVDINGSRVLTEYDPFVAAGNTNHKLTCEESNATADGSGNITVVLTSVLNSASIVAIAVADTGGGGGPTLNNTKWWFAAAAATSRGS